MNPLKYLSICSGICASTVAWQWLDWSPIAFSEIEPFPSAVLAHRHPGVPNLGDMTRFPEWPEELLAEVDLLVGGTPCQAFSVAGLRASLSDDRGNLTLVYVALVNHIDTIRAAHGRPPVICVWENVPGVLSTKDNAFGCFLGGLAGAGLPLLAPGGAWEYAGYVRGPLRAIAWRSLDAQYFGVPQRRHRVFAVASAGDGFRPEEILFESEGLRRDSPPRREAWENPAPTLSARTNGGGGLGTDFNLDGGLISSTGEISHCLNAGGMGRQDYETETMICSLPAVCPSCCHSLIDKNLAVCGDTCPACSDPLLGVSHSLRAQPQSAHDASLETYVTHALTAEGHDASEDGTGRGTPIIPVPFGVDESPDVAHCLRSGASKADKHESTTYIAQHIGFDSLQAGDTMMGITYDGSPPLRGCQGRVAVAFAENSRAEIRLENGDGQQTGALSTGGGKPGQGTPTIAYTLHGTDGTTSVVSEDDTAQCLLARAPGIANSASTIVLSYAVRRLTPRECERLQGFPDDFTQIPWRGKPVDQCPDGPRYKALGNSMAVTCMLWIGRRIAAYEAWKGGEKTEKPNSQQTWTCSDCHEKVTDISPVGPPGVIICEDCANPKRAKPRTLEYMIEPTPQPEQEQMEGPTPSTEKAFNDTYSYSFDGENYQGSFDSREHAAEEAFAEDDTAQSVWTGRSIVPDRTLSAADVIEQVACSTTEESGDWSDGYLTGLPPKALQELEAELQALWDRWEAKYGLEPNWFNVEDCKEHFRVDVPEN